MRTISFTAMFFILASAAVAGPSVTVTEIKVPALPLPDAVYYGGNTLKLNLGIGSAAWRDAKDPPGVIWTITDRGPNLDCAGIDKIAGLALDTLCAGDDKAKNFPLPDFTPTIAKIEIGPDNVARLWKIDRGTGKVAAEFVYTLDDATSFRADNKKEAQKQNAVRLSEMVAVGEDRLLVLERISKTTKIYLVDLGSGSALDAVYDDPAASPSLEQLSAADLESKGIKPLVKTLLLDSDDVDNMPKKIEAMAVMSPTEMIVLSDSDFGIEGDETGIRRVVFSEPVLQ